MKKICLISVLLLLTAGLRAQSLTISTSTSVCYSGWSPGTSTALAFVTATPTTATSYSWSSSTWSMNCSANITATGTGTAASILYPCCGPYTITCVAYNGTTQVGYASQTVSVLCNSNLNITSPQGFLSCNGNSVAMVGSGGSNYTWTDGTSTLSTNGTVVVTPTANTCYTLNVTGSSGCQFSIVKCVTVTGVPSLTVTSTAASTNNCAYSGHTLTASGANSYSWFYANGGNFANAASTVVGPASNSCYTVIGTAAPGCTASAAICVTVQPGPSLTLNISPGLTVCPGSPVFFSASGGVNYTWTAYSQTAMPSNISNSSSAIAYPTHNFYTVTIASTNSLGCASYSMMLLHLGSSTIQVSGGTSFCAGQSKTLSTLASGPYQWSDGTGVISTSSFVVVSPTASTCYSLTAGTGNCSLTSVCLNLVNPPNITATGGTFCQGSAGYLSLSGGVHYAALTYTTNNQWITIGTVNSSTCITVTGYNSAGCSNTAVACVTMAPQPVLSNTASTVSACAGQSVNLGTSNIVVGWSVAELKPFSVWPVLSYTGTNVAITPTASGVFSVTAYSNGCYPSFITTITIVPNPIVGITGNNTLCAGASLGLSGSGAITYTWSTGQTGANIIVNPATNTCVTVVGTNSFGCTGTAVKCVTVLTAPVMISPASATVCKGTSQTFTASGAATYTWSTSSSASTINVLPLVTTLYTVYGTGSNGCPGTAVVTLSVDSTCSDVWPGDANSDGVVGTTDVLEIGYAFNSTGSARNPGGNSYVAQRASNWAGTVSSGKNKCHADCDGNGTVSFPDTMAIFTNFSQTHAFRSSGGTGNDIRVETDATYFTAGSWHKVDVVIGDVSNTFQLYGVTFDLDFTEQLTEESFLVYTSSFLNANNQNVEFRKKSTNGGRIYAATVRTDQSNVTGNGKIAELHFKIKPGTENQFMSFSLSNGIRADASRVQQTLEGNSAAVQIAGADVGFADNSATAIFSLLPNPAADQVRLLAPGVGPNQYSICDVQGRLVDNGSFSSQITVNTSELTAGVYFVTCRSGEIIKTMKLVIQR